MRKSKKKIALSIMSIVTAFALLAGVIGVADMLGEPIVAVPALASGSSNPPPSQPSTPSKSENPIRVKAKTVKVDGAELETKTQKIKKNKAFKITDAEGSVKFKKKKGDKKISISKKGVIKIKKGLEPGTYKLKVAVTASGNSSYKSATQTVTVKIKVV